MKAIILAAGMGKRLYPLTDALPKCLLKLNTKSILEYQIEKLNECGVRDIVVVIGYMANKIREAIGDKVKFIFNPFYHITNSIASLWLAKNEIPRDEDLFLLNSDIIFDADILKELMHSEKGIYMLVEKRSDCTDADFRLKVIDGLVVDMGKTLGQFESFGEYVGIVKVSKNMVPSFIKTLDSLIESGKVDLWYELTLQEMINNGFEIKAFETRGKYWIEIDLAEDLEKAKEKFQTLEIG